MAKKKITKKKSKYVEMPYHKPALCISIKHVIHLCTAQLVERKHVKDWDYLLHGLLVKCACGRHMSGPQYAAQMKGTPTIAEAAIIMAENWTVCEDCARAEGDKHMYPARMWLTKSYMLIAGLAMKIGMVQEPPNQWLYTADTQNKGGYDAVETGVVWAASAAGALQIVGREATVRRIKRPASGDKVVMMTRTTEG